MCSKVTLPKKCPKRTLSVKSPRNWCGLRGETLTKFLIGDSTYWGPSEIQIPFFCYKLHSITIFHPDVPLGCQRYPFFNKFPLCHKSSRLANKMAMHSLQERDYLVFEGVKKGLLNGERWKKCDLKLVGNPIVGIQIEIIENWSSLKMKKPRAAFARADIIWN